MGTKGALVGSCEANWALEKFNIGALTSRKTWRYLHEVKMSDKLQLFPHSKKIAISMEHMIFHHEDN